MTRVGTQVRQTREDFPDIPPLQSAWSRWRWEFDFEAAEPITAILLIDYGPERAWVRLGRDLEMILLPLCFEIEPFDRRNRAIGEVRLRVRRQVHNDGYAIQRAIEDPRLLTDPVPIVHPAVTSGETVSTGALLEVLRLDVPDDLRASVLMVPTEATHGGRTGTWRLRKPLPSPHPEWLAALDGGRRTGRCPRPSS